MSTSKTYITVHSGDGVADQFVQLTIDDAHHGYHTLGVKTLASVFPGATNLRIGRDGPFLRVNGDEIELPADWPDHHFYCYTPPNATSVTAHPKLDEWSRLTREQELTLVHVVRSLCFSTEQGACVTVVKKRYAVTFAHKNHAHWRQGDVVSIFRLAENIDPATGRMGGPIPVKVALEPDKEKDLVLLVSECDLCFAEVAINQGAQGEAYIQTGLSAHHYTPTQSPFTTPRGVIASTLVDKHGYFIGSAGSTTGDSGGGVYNLFGEFLGMNVGSDAAPALTLDQTGHQMIATVSTRYASRARIVSGILIQEVINTYERQQRQSGSVARSTSGT